MAKRTTKFKPEITVFEAVIESLNEATKYNPDDVVAPAVVLWTDKDGQWESLMPLLRDRLPQLMTLGQYNPQSKTGPAIWVRCMLARVLPEADWQEGTVPILYCPNVSRQELRAVEECPPFLQPLAELQYRGVFWSHPNGKDWTIRAFLESDHGGLGLDVSGDNESVETMQTALVKLSEAKIAELQGKRIDAGFLQRLLTPDADKSLLSWLNSPDATRQTWTDAEWGAFRNMCRNSYGFDPETNGDIGGGELLGMRQNSWKTVWERYAEAPAAYPKLPDLLRRCRPQTLFANDPSSWPQDNEEQEAEVRKFLNQLVEVTFDGACNLLVELEKKHGERRNWVWNTLGLSPLACALEHLSILASVVREPLGGPAAEDMANTYVKHGWSADAAVLRALACVSKTPDIDAVTNAVISVYKPWLERSAEQFQSIVKQKGYPKSSDASTSSEERCCILFVDGLRYDLSVTLRELLISQGMTVNSKWAWAAYPTVTPTAKPAISPIHSLLAGSSQTEDFSPQISDGNQPLTTLAFRQLLGSNGYQVLSDKETGNPTGKAWTEFGDFDETGHAQQWKLSWRITEGLNSLVGRIQELLRAGWKQVRIVTDHGWLLIPGGLPKAELPGFLVDARWSRSALLKDGAKADVIAVPWHWNPTVHIATARGISAFKAGLEYSHGGLSLQECVVPQLTIVDTNITTANVRIDTVEWKKLRCRVEISGAPPGCSLDIRTIAAKSDLSILVEVQTFDTAGRASVLVANHEFESKAAFVVVLDADNKVIAKIPTEVGA